MRLSLDQCSCLKLSNACAALHHSFRHFSCPLLPQLAMAVAMVGATYAAVPLYRMFCQV